MHPQLFKVGPLEITSFGAMAACGFLAASLLLFANRRTRGVSGDAINDLTLYAIIAGIVGARLFYVVQFWPEYSRNWFQIFKIWQGGLVFYGGFIAAFAAVYAYCRIKKLDFLGVIDIIAPSLAVGHALGRIGCFLNGCCYGRPTDIPWGIQFPQGSLPFRHHPFDKLHPTQLYESIFNAILAAFLILLLRRTQKKGAVAATYLVVYGAGRFAIESLRGDNLRMMNLMTVSQFIGLVLVAAGAYIFMTIRKPSGDDGENGSQKSRKPGK